MPNIRLQIITRKGLTELTPLRQFSRHFHFVADSDRVAFGVGVQEGVPAEDGGVPTQE